ncbi:hypothetical protein NDU88_004719 [Pleurodeles waltl]|uniref:Uncharacterized protein n=1 Tax=Pleurodeles waltl TaxID=8319 RepID=A0AAV7TS24_PLEWA|nr:hypothetical protein NDU88_004719 [Pleurodeles waltl]
MDHAGQRYSTRLRADTQPSPGHPPRRAPFQGSPGKEGVLLRLHQCWGASISGLGQRGDRPSRGRTTEGEHSSPVFGGHRLPPHPPELHWTLRLGCSDDRSNPARPARCPHRGCTPLGRARSVPRCS